MSESVGSCSYESCPSGRVERRRLAGCPSMKLNLGLVCTEIGFPRRTGKLACSVPITDESVTHFGDTLQRPDA